MDWLEQIGSNQQLRQPASRILQQFFPQGFPGASVLQVSQMQAWSTLGRALFQGMISDSTAVLAYQLNFLLVQTAWVSPSSFWFILADMYPWDPTLLSFLEEWWQQTSTRRPKTSRPEGMGTVISMLAVVWWREISEERYQGLILVTFGLLDAREATFPWRLARLWLILPTLSWRLYNEEVSPSIFPCIFSRTTTLVMTLLMTVLKLSIASWQGQSTTYSFVFPPLFPLSPPFGWSMGGPLSPPSGLG